MPENRNVIFDGGELVLASEDERIVEGRLLPFNTIGHTNVGAFTVEAGVLELPSDPEVIGLNIEHDREQPVGRAIEVSAREDGVYGKYRIARTPEGDQALADIKSGKRKGQRRPCTKTVKKVVRGRRSARDQYVISLAKLKRSETPKLRAVALDNAGNKAASTVVLKLRTGRKR